MAIIISTEKQREFVRNYLRKRLKEMKEHDPPLSDQAFHQAGIVFIGYLFLAPILRKAIPFLAHIFSPSLEDAIESATSLFSQHLIVNTILIPNILPYLTDPLKGLDLEPHAELALLDYIDTQKAAHLLSSSGEPYCTKYVEEYTLSYMDSSREMGVCDPDAQKLAAEIFYKVTTSDDCPHVTGGF